MPSLRLIKPTLVLIATIAVASCSPPQAQNPAPRAERSTPTVCQFAQQLKAYGQQTKTQRAEDTKTLRFLNEQWRSLAKANSFRSEQAAQESRAQLTALNYQLADESLALLAQAHDIAWASYEKIERLRQYSAEGAGAPASMKRELNSQLQDCCMRTLSSNSQWLVREAKDSALYEVGRIGYFVQRDLSQLMNNELTFAAYQQQRDAVAEQLAQVQRPEFNHALTWANCGRLK